MEIIAEILLHIALFILKLFGELLLQAFGELIAEFIGRSAKEPFRRPKPIHPFLAAVGYGIFGGITGLISLWLVPKLFVSAPWLRIVNLVLTPIAVGVFMERLGAWRRKHNQATIRLDTFVYGFVFAISMALVRFTWGK
jgi:hypothetical protein